MIIAGFSAALYWDQERTLSAQVDRSLASASWRVLARIDDTIVAITFVDSDAYRHASSDLAQAGSAVVLLSPSRRVLAGFGRGLELSAQAHATSEPATIETTLEGAEEHW